MNTQTEIKPAIGRSISHNEIVRLEVADPKEALSNIDNDENVTDLDWNTLTLNGENVKGGLDVWGTRPGGDFRLYIYKTN